LRADILTVKVQHTETSANLFMALWTSTQLLWEIFIDFHVLFILFVIHVLGIIPDVLLVD